MAYSNNIEVVIGGKVLTLSGSESEEYLSRVASFINNKLSELSKSDSYKRQSQDMQSILLALNIADDYFKAKEQIASLEETVDNKEKELYNIKHELIASQIKLENTEKNVKKLEAQNSEYSGRITRLETELKN